MDIADKDSLLQEIPLFSGLSADELSLISARCEVVEYKKGDVIYAEGAPADAFYCIILGRSIICTKDAHGNERVLEYLHRGKYFGIISLLTGGPHSVTARALNDCALLEIKKEDFDFILKSVPQLAIDLSQTLSRRLKDKDIHQKTIFESTIVSVFSSYSEAGKTVYAMNLALSLHNETKKSVIIIDCVPQGKTPSLPSRLHIASGYQGFDLESSQQARGAVVSSALGIDLLCIMYGPKSESAVKKLLGMLTFLVNEYNYIILDLPSRMDQFVLGVLNQSDLIHLLTSPEPADLKETRDVIERLKADFHFHEAKIKVIINEYKLSTLTYSEQHSELDHPIYATLPRIEFESSDIVVVDLPESEYAKAVRRIARRLGDCLVGLALGVGAAYGFCHIGVLKVIEEEKIPIDVISGSSIGAVIASLWVTGRSAHEILKISGEFEERKFVWGLVDLTFPSLGFIKGKRLYNFLKKYLGNKTFYDIKLPLKIIASDIRRKEPRILDKGLLVDAIMASCSMPGVFRPFKLKEEVLFDGGITNPLPTETLFKMGVNKIIAVNVTPSREDILLQCQKLKEEMDSGVAGAKKKWLTMERYFAHRVKSSIIDIIFSSIEVMQSELVQQESAFADLVLHPDTQGLHWLEFHKSAAFAKRGEEEARKNLSRIWQIIRE